MATEGMDWNECYARSETPWEKGLPTPVLDEMWQRHNPLFKGHVFVPGCGVGHDARWLADQGVQVVGGDVAPLAIAAAKNWDETSPVDFRLVNVLKPDSELIGYFDGVWEHTCFCALDPEMRGAYLKGIKAVLKPGGRVAGVFFINPEMDEGEIGPPFGVEVETLQNLWLEHGFEVVDSWVPQTGYEGRVGRELALILTRL